MTERNRSRTHDHDDSQTAGHPVESLLSDCEALAQARHDGHITLYRFTTGWKVVAGTPDMSLDEREALWQLPGRMSLVEALQEFLRRAQP